MFNLHTSEESYPSVGVQLGDVVKTIRVKYSGGSESCGGFPSHSTGCFYFCPAEHGRPQLSASIRFRLASTVQDFSTGEDLKLPNGEVWNRPVFLLPKGPTYRPLYEKIVEEGLVSHEMDCEIQSLSSEGDSSRSTFYRTSTFLYTLSDPFVLDLSSRSKNIWGVSKAGTVMGKWLTPYCDRRVSLPNMSPYNGTSFLHCSHSFLVPTTFPGSIRVRFEKSTLQEHDDTRAVVVRVLDVLEPIQVIESEYDRRLPPPQKGDLLYDTRGKHVTFSLDGVGGKGSSGDKSISSVLRLLW